MDLRRVNRFDHFYGIAFVHAALSVGMGLVQYLHDRDVWIGGLTMVMTIMALCCACVYRVDMRRQRRENDQLIAEIEAATKMDPRQINRFNYTIIYVTCAVYCMFIVLAIVWSMHHDQINSYVFYAWFVFVYVLMCIMYDEVKCDWERQVARNEELIRSIEAAITKV